MRTVEQDMALTFSLAYAVVVLMGLAWWMQAAVKTIRDSFRRRKDLRATKGGE